MDFKRTRTVRFLSQSLQSQIHLKYLIIDMKKEVPELDPVINNSIKIKAAERIPKQVSRSLTTIFKLGWNLG